MDRDFLNQLLTEKRYLELKTALSHLQEMDIADFIDALLDEKHVIIVFRLLDKEMAADVFSNLNTESQEIICNLAREEEFRGILDDLFFDDMIDLIQEMPAFVVKRIMQHKGEKERSLINQFLNYKAGTAGSLMTIEFVDLHRDMTVKEAMLRIKRDAEDKETVYICYVIDNARHLVGIVSLRDIIVAEETEIIGDIMIEDIISVTTGTDQEEVADSMQRYDLLAIPVVDSESRLVGIVTIDDIMDVVEEESTEDMLIMAAVTPSDDDYAQQGVFTLAKKRAPWLLLLMISATISGAIIRSFEATLAAYVGLTAFIPMLMDTGGNAGSQSSTTVIRALTLGEIEFRDILKVMWKEIRVSFLVGAMLAVINFLRVVFLEKYGVNVAIVVSGTLMFTVVFAKALGGSLPLIAKKLGLDPALMASPLITTIVDAVSLIIYFQIAAAVFGL
ncbi:magnesium transporter [Eubacteriales bacterium OttesenSCG-928-M02]|nr:magnesium transporter [Eubacteriales bacterium OttesenSCG-928-M02]